MSHCATNFDELRIDQDVAVVFGAGDVRPGYVERITGAFAYVRLNDGSVAECRPYAVIVADHTGPPPGLPLPMQLDLFQGMP
ncbi:hypothetical protein ABW16_01870 [Mycolicibacter heraklionensis]|uniref:Uncharacterized protein n=1 Tax=Mycolicibacter heraklionensis TaxID=512402 RepID=A0ABR5FKU6_9MYCO|nr:hypothetical protein [Mycolicibacter heraklionensis]KLO31600.1 hypothetical protein ABW16_01870 [Mycolicibacter heraklionensis]